MAKVGVLNTPFTRDPMTPPGRQDKFGKCTEGNPDPVKSPGDDTPLGIVFYHSSPGLTPSGAALVSPQGTGITGLGKPKSS